MRYYDITLTRDATGTDVVRQWTSHPKGVFDPGAQNIDFDIPVTVYGTPTGGQMLMIEGVALEDLKQPQTFAGLYLTMKAGMQKGLPLANPKQAGKITAGQIFQSFGNWQGVDQSLNFLLNPGLYSSGNPGNFVLNWKANTTLASALDETLKVAYPNLVRSINISDQLVQNHDENGFAGTYGELAQKILGITKGNFLGDRYQGVQMTIQSGQVIVYDSTAQAATVELAFTDFIGQPAWIDVNVMQIPLVMRGDLQLNSRVKFPQGMMNAPGVVSTAASSLPSSQKYKSTFQGLFVIVDIRHVGNYRGADGASWATIVQCIPIPNTAAN
jgi:hypothetical protein